MKDTFNVEEDQEQNFHKFTYSLDFLRILRAGLLPETY